MDDLEAVALRVASGDRAAYRLVVEITLPRMFRLAARLMGNVIDAEDVLQDAHLRALDALSAGQFDRRSGLETWLYRIVANTAVDALRSRRRRARLTSDAHPAMSTSGDQAIARAALRELDEWLGELPPDQRTALVLKEVEGLSTSEIATMLECSVGAIEQRLVRARAELRRRLSDG